MTQQPILLLESEESVIKDVTCSLRLVDIPVLASFDVVDAKRVAIESRPNLVLARARIGGDSLAGVNLARALAGEGAGFSVVALYAPGEKGLIDEHRDLFVSEIGLPVEFPHFTRQVQQILASLQPEAQEGHADKAGAASSVKPAEVPHQPPAESAAEVRGRNLLIAYDLQLGVLDQLRQDPHLSKASVREMVDLVQDTTKRVCASFDQRKFIKH